MSPTQLPAAQHKRLSFARRFLRKPLAATTVISFSLTFVVAGVLYAIGVIPPRAGTGFGNLDAGVLMLFVPLCALILAITVEVVRSILRDGLRTRPRSRHGNPLASWKPGMGES